MVKQATRQQINIRKGQSMFLWQINRFQEGEGVWIVFRRYWKQSWFLYSFFLLNEGNLWTLTKDKAAKLSKELGIHFYKEHTRNKTRIQQEYTVKTVSDRGTQVPANNALCLMVRLHQPIAIVYRGHVRMWLDLIASHMTARSHGDIQWVVTYGTAVHIVVVVLTQCSCCIGTVLCAMLWNVFHVQRDYQHGGVFISKSSK